MTIKSSLTAVIAVFSVALLFAPAANAQEKTDTQKNEKPPVTTVVVQLGDTLTSIAEAHGTTYSRLYDANAQIADPNQIDIGDEVRVPQSDENLPDRLSAYTAQAATYSPASTTTSRTYTSTPVNSSSYYVGNGMWCTDYVHSKRPDVAVYGNAGYNWLSSAKAAGKSTGTAPQAGAVAVTNGHVAYVESVNSDGSYVVSEMGWNYKAGNYNKRTVSPGAFGGFIY